MLQSGCSLEKYAEEFLELYHEAWWDDEALKYLFWSRLDGILEQVLL